MPSKTYKEPRVCDCGYTPVFWNPKIISQRVFPRISFEFFYFTLPPPPLLFFEILSKVLYYRVFSKEKYE